MQGNTYWNGTVWGTNSGALLVELTRDGQALSGSFALIQPGLGTTKANLSGTWSENNQLNATLTQFTAETSVQVILPKDGQFTGIFDATQSVIKGDWHTGSGTNGHFVLVSGPKISLPVQPNKGHQTAPPAAPKTVLGQPLVTTTLNLGAVRLDQDGLTNLAEIIREGTAVEQPAINASHRGREYIHIGIASLLKEAALPGFVDTVILSVNESVNNLGFKTVVVRLVKDGQNTVYVSGYDRIWVEGKAKQIEVALMDYQNRMIGFWRKYGANLNGIVFLALLWILPSVPSILDRFKVIIVTFIFLLVLKATWTKAANTRVFLHDKLVPAHIRYAEYIVTPLAVLFSAIVAFLIQRYVHPH
jgi:hypothetical protein